MDPVRTSLMDLMLITILVGTLKTPKIVPTSEGESKLLTVANNESGGGPSSSEAAGVEGYKRGDNRVRN